MISRCSVCGDVLSHIYADNLCDKCRKGGSGKTVRQDLHDFTSELRGRTIDEVWDDSELRKAISTHMEEK